MLLKDEDCLGVRVSGNRFRIKVTTEIELLGAGLEFDSTRSSIRSAYKIKAEAGLFYLLRTGL
ncbi:hypothetical protein TUM3792_41170 [Shewanella sp. MBTL60-007]|nr:hypothetical protein TUM3792_41170 [Shewanella sp. MBTL60-007]